MGLSANKWCVKKAVLRQCVKGHSGVMDSGWMLYLKLTAWHRTRPNRVRMEELPRKNP